MIDGRMPATDILHGLIAGAAGYEFTAEIDLCIYAEKS